MRENTRQKYRVKDHRDNFSSFFIILASEHFTSGSKIYVYYICSAGLD